MLALPQPTMWRLEGGTCGQGQANANISRLSVSSIMRTKRQKRRRSGLGAEMVGGFLEAFEEVVIFMWKKYERACHVVGDPSVPAELSQVYPEEEQLRALQCRVVCLIR